LRAQRPSNYESLKPELLAAIDNNLQALYEHAVGLLLKIDSANSHGALAVAAAHNPYSPEEEFSPEARKIAGEALNIITTPPPPGSKTQSYRTPLGSTAMVFNLLTETMTNKELIAKMKDEYGEVRAVKTVGPDLKALYSLNLIDKIKDYRGRYTGYKPLVKSKEKREKIYYVLIRLRSKTKFDQIKSVIPELEAIGIKPRAAAEKNGGVTMADIPISVEPGIMPAELPGAGPEFFDQVAFAVFNPCPVSSLARLAAQ